MPEPRREKIIAIFQEETLGRIQAITRSLLELEKDISSPEAILDIRRQAHTIKGAARMLGLEDIGQTAHSLEDVIADISTDKSGNSPTLVNQAFAKVDALKILLDNLNQQTLAARKQESFLKVPQEKIEKFSVLIWYINEESARLKKNLESLKAMLSRFEGTKDKPSPLATREDLSRELESLFKNFLGQQAHLDDLITQLQDSLQSVRLIPLAVLLEDLPREVRDISAKEQKQIEVLMHTGTVGIDKFIAEEIKTAFIHIINNAVRHGIESPAQRLRLNKSEKGTICVSAAMKANRVIIEIEDDGQGINPERVRELALQKGLIRQEQLQRMLAKDIMRMILLPGFSSSTSVDMLSGRGIGLNTVRTNLERLGGSIDVESQPQRFTRFILSLPLTIGSISAILAKSGEAIFALPAWFVSKIVQANASDIISKEGCDFLKFDRLNLPIVELNKLLQLPASAAKPGSAEVLVIINSSGTSWCLRVGEILEERELLLRNFGSYLNKVKYLLGAAILQGGRVCLVLDIPEIFSSAIPPKE